MQNDIKDVLKNQLRGEKFSHAYLIETNDINGYIDELKDILKLFMCEESPNVCNNCQHCHYIDELEHPNINIIKPETNYIKMEQIESLQEKLKYKTSFGRFNIYVILGAEKLNQSSANALLKTLEDPEEDIIAILLTSNRSLVMPTIVSRCQFLKSTFGNVSYSKEVIDIAKQIDEYSNWDKITDYSKILNEIEDKNQIKEAFGYLLNMEVEKCTNIKKINLLKEIVDKMRYNVNMDLLLFSYLLRMCEINE